MAIFHLSVKCVGRSAGQSAVAAAAYRAGAKLLDSRTGELHDYVRRRDVAASALVLPEGAPGWTRSELWNSAERAELRRNSTVARECEVALPCELTRPQQFALTVAFAKWLVVRHGFAADIAMHAGKHRSTGGGRNDHAHILLTTRRLLADGFDGKTRELDAAATGSKEIHAWRACWAAMSNEALEHHGHASRVDHRSHAARGLVELPTTKEGRGAAAGPRAMRNQVIRRINAEIADAIGQRAAAVAAAKMREASSFATSAIRRPERQPGPKLRP